MATTLETTFPTDRPARFTATKLDYYFMAAVLWLVGGLMVDGWAHAHLDLSKEGFFTPFHALFYSGYAACAAVVILAMRENLRAGASRLAAIPAGYDVTLAGLVLFALGGIGDMLWHLAFGIEQDMQALLSPTHLTLALAGAMIVCGPMRALALRERGGTFASQLPAFVSLALLLTILQFFVQWTLTLSASYAAAPAMRYPALGGDARDEFAFFQLSHGVLGAIVRGAMLAGIAIYLATRLPYRRGAALLVFTLSGVLLGCEHAGFGSGLISIALPAFVAGLAAEMCFTLAAWRALPESWRLAVLGFFVPFSSFAAYMLMLGGHSWWEVHAQFGMPVEAGYAGALLGLLVARPRPNTA